jgi:hypothetical protein
MKKVIKKRVLECIIEQQKNTEYFNMFPRDLGNRLTKSLELREKYHDIIPMTAEMKQNALDYINALEVEDYETCSNFIIE